jgi:MarR family 2-MHQ and catechol resistance regulon transcriptional repressor
MPTHYDGTQEEKRALDLFIKLFRATDSVMLRTSEAMVSGQLTPSQFGVLETLYHLGPLMLSQIAAKHLKSRNNFTVVIDNLEKLGLVQRERDLEDRRAITVHLTPKGEELIKELLPKHVEGVVKEMSILTAEEQIQLAALLKKLGKRDRPAELPKGCDRQADDLCSE